MSVHTVVQGEHLTGIAAAYGFGDAAVVWNDPQNAALREQRKNPNVLLPGDEVSIPEKTAKEVAAATDQRHRFRRHGGPFTLRLVLLTLDGKPAGNLPVVVEVDGDSSELTTDAQGRVELPLAATAAGAVLRWPTPEAPFAEPMPLRIGYLDPVDSETGIAARLENLGYFAGPVDTPRDDPELADARARRLRVAVEEFQCEQGLAVDGVAGPQTQARLLKVHGC